MNSQNLSVRAQSVADYKTKKEGNLQLSASPSCPTFLSSAVFYGVPILLLTFDMSIRSRWQACSSTL